MKKEDVTKYLNKRVKIFLKKNNIIYTCDILEVSETSCYVLDKFNTHATIDLEDVSCIVEQNGGNNQ